MAKKTVTPANLRQVQRRLDRLERYAEVTRRQRRQLDTLEKAILLLKKRLDKREEFFTTVPPAE